MIPSNQRRSVTPDEQRSEAAGSATFPSMSAPAPPPMSFTTPSTVSIFILGRGCNKRNYRSRLTKLTFIYKIEIFLSLESIRLL